VINMKDLIKKQTDMIRKESGINIKEEKLNEAEQYGIKFSPQDHYDIHKSLIKNGIGNGVDYSESWDVYGWKDKNNYKKAVGELNAAVLKTYKPYYVAKEKLDKVWKQKDKIFNKWRKKDGSKQGD